MSTKTKFVHEVHSGFEPRIASIGLSAAEDWSELIVS
jgi:hypothetical protein